MAAFDFPNSPSVNDQYTANGVTFKWNGTIWQRISASSGAQGTTGSTGPTGAQGAAAGLTISTSAPGSPSAGDMWWDSDSGLFLTYYNDGNSSQWVELNQGPKGAQGATGPTGAQGATGPTGAQGAAGAQGATAAAGAQGASGSATLSNNADNRVITGGSGTNLNGEANFTYDGDIATITRSANAAGGLSIINTNNSQASAHARLELSAGDNSSAIMRMECNGHSNELIADGSGNFRIDDNGTERLRIDASGSLLIANTTGSRTNLSGNADDIVIGNTSTSNETGISMFSTNASGIRFNDASGTDGAIEYAHSARELRFNSAGANRLQFGINASNSPVFSLGTGHYSGDSNNHNQGDRTSAKVGAYLHLESANGAGHNTRAGLGYNCYFHSLEDFYCGTKSPSSGDNRPAAYGMAYGNHYFYSDASNTAHLSLIHI